MLAESDCLQDACFTVESAGAQLPGTIPMIRPERVRLAVGAELNCADAALRQSLTGTVIDMVYAGALRRRVGSSLLVVREHVAAGQDVFKPGDEVHLQWLRSDVRFVAK